MKMFLFTVSVNISDNSIQLQRREIAYVPQAVRKRCLQIEKNSVIFDRACSIGFQCAAKRSNGQT